MPRKQRPGVDLISKSAFARLQGLSTQRMTQYVQAGMPVVDGMIQPTAAIEWIEKHVSEKSREAQKKGRRKDVPGDGETRSELERQLAAVKLELNHLEVRKTRGELIDRDHVLRCFDGLGRKHRDSYKYFVAAAANAIAAEHGGNEGLIHSTLTRLVREHLSNLELGSIDDEAVEENN